MIIKQMWNKFKVKLRIGKRLGLGRSSEVYKYGTGKVLKLYFKEHPYVR